MKHCTKCGTALTPEATVCQACGEARPPDLKHRLMAEAALTPEDLQSPSPATISSPAEAAHSRPSPSLAESMAQIDAKKRRERDSINQHLKVMATRGIAPTDQHLFSSPTEEASDALSLHLKPAAIGLLAWLLLSLLLRPHASSVPSFERVFLACIPLYTGLFCLFWAAFGEFIYDVGWFLWALVPKDSMYTQTARHQREGNLSGFLKALAWLAGSYGGTVAVYYHFYNTMPMFQH